MSDTFPVGDDLVEQQIDSETQFRGKLLHVLRDRVRLPDGSESVREYITHPGAVAVIACPAPGRVLLLRQHRYPLRRDFIEIPAGKLDHGEDPLACGKRELEEETGYTATEWQRLTVIHPCIGYSDEVIHIYQAKGLIAGQAKLDHGEFLHAFETDLTHALTWIQDGLITDPKTMLGLLWLQCFSA